MATTITNISQTQTLTNLDTYNYTVPTGGAGMYVVSVKLNEVPDSSITMTLKQGSTTRASTSAPQAGQSHDELRVIMNCADADVIGVVLASSAAIDNQLNDFKVQLKITPGLI